MARKRVAILISGRGSNLKALAEAARAPDYPAEIVLAVADRKDAPGLAIAEAEGIAVKTFPYREIGNKKLAEAMIQRALREAGIEIVCLAGFMRVLSAEFVEAWQGRMINIHPSLLPAFPGLDTHRRALEAGAAEHGCTVHFVSPEVDSGEVIAQAGVPVLAGDTAETLAARVLAEEHKLYPEALRKVAGGSLG